MRIISIPWRFVLQYLSYFLTHNRCSIWGSHQQFSNISICCLMPFLTYTFPAWIFYYYAKSFYVHLGLDTSYFMFVFQGLKIRKQRSTGDLDRKGVMGSIRSTGSTSSWMSSESNYAGASVMSEGSQASFVVEVRIWWQLNFSFGDVYH